MVRSKTEIHLSVPTPASPSKAKATSTNQPASGVLSSACPGDKSRPERQTRRKQSQTPSVRNPQLTRRDPPMLHAYLVPKTRLPVPSLPENPLHLPSPFRSRSCDPLTTSPPQTKPNRESIP